MTSISHSTYVSRVFGSLYGLAIGDALGFPVEFSKQTPSSRVVFDLDARDIGPDGKPCAFYSDDTQMTRAVMIGLLNAPDEGAFRAATREVALQFVEWARNPPGGHRAPGGACLYGCANLARGVSPLESGQPVGAAGKGGGGCGAVMRSAPYAWMFPNGSGLVAASWAAAHAKMTHLHPMAAASSAALAAAVHTAMHAPPTRWHVAQAAHAAALQIDAQTAGMIAHAMWMATAPGKAAWTPTMVLDKFRGWAGHEAIAGAIYCFLMHPYNYREAVLLAVNSPGDSDSLGCITGAISGAYLGLPMLPKEWVAKVERSDELATLAGRFTDAFYLDPPKQE